MRQQLNNGGLAKLIAKMSPEQKAYYDTLPDTQKEGYLKSLGLDGMSAGTGMAIAAGAELAGQAVQAIDQNDGTLSPEGNVASKALQYGGKGAGIGTMIAPGVGTAIGAGAGALLGAGMGLMENKKNKDDQNQADKAARHAAGQASMDVAGRIGAKDGGKIGAASGLVESILGPIAPKQESTALIQQRQGKAQGGQVVGPGGPKEDAVDTQLPENSFVVPAENAVIAKQLREMYLNKPTKKMKGGGPVPVSLSNGEHVFTPDEVKVLEGKGVNLHYLAPNAEQTGMGYQHGGRVKLNKGGSVTDEQIQKRHRKEIEALYGDQNMQAYLAGIRHGEEDPKKKGASKNPNSTATGSYQFLEKSRKEILKKYGYDAWSENPDEQAKAAIALIYDNSQWGNKEEKKVVENILAGNFDAADKVLGGRQQWTSLPYGSEKNSKTDEIQSVREKYLASNGKEYAAQGSGNLPMAKKDNVPLPTTKQNPRDAKNRFFYLVDPSENDINPGLVNKILNAQTPEELKKIIKSNDPKDFNKQELKALGSKRELLYSRRHKLPGDSVMTRTDYNDLLSFENNRRNAGKNKTTVIGDDIPDGLAASIDQKVSEAWKKPKETTWTERERSKRMDENAQGIKDSQKREKLRQMAVNDVAGVPVTLDGLTEAELEYYDDVRSNLIEAQQNKQEAEATEAENAILEEQGFDPNFRAKQFSKNSPSEYIDPNNEQGLLREKISNPEVFQNKPAPEADRINVLESLGGFRGLLAIGQTAMGLAGVLSKKGDPGDYTPDPTLMRLRDEAILDSTRMDPAIKASAETNMELTRRATNESIQQQAGGDTGLALANMNRSAIAKNRAIVDLAAEQERTSMQKKQYAAGLAGQVAGEHRYGYDQRRNDFVANQQAAAGLMNTGLENLIQGQMYRSWNEGLKKIEDQQKSYQQKMTEDFNNMFKNNDKPSGGIAG